jgi:NTP pyrophosphatase (non-canonical NTP hydrolase)
MDHKDFINNVDYIRSKTSMVTRCDQLAEECAELAKAALKVSRYVRDDNPPNDSVYELASTLKEEMADVLFMMHLIHEDGDIIVPGIPDSIETDIWYKSDRWVERIKARESLGSR